MQIKIPKHYAELRAYQLPPFIWKPDLYKLIPEESIYTKKLYSYGIILDLSDNLRRKTSLKKRF
jgi:hypothetical protein